MVACEVENIFFNLSIILFGAKFFVQLFEEMYRTNQKYGMVSACVGGEQGVAWIYELL
jgi:acetyl-CoA acetyltransferase